MRVEVVVCPGEVLPVVASEVQMVQGMVSWAVEPALQPRIGDHVSVMDEYGPELDSNKEDCIEVLLHWADEDEHATRKVSGYPILHEMESYW